MLAEASRAAQTYFAVPRGPHSNGHWPLPRLGRQTRRVYATHEHGEIAALRDRWYMYALTRRLYTLTVSLSLTLSASRPPLSCRFSLLSPHKMRVETGRHATMVAMLEASMRRAPRIHARLEGVHALIRLVHAGIRRVHALIRRVHAGIASRAARPPQTMRS